MRRATCTICLRDSGARRPRPRGSGRAQIGALAPLTFVQCTPIVRRTMTYTVRTRLRPRTGRRFGETEALSGLDLAVAPGTVLGLLGHNGAGKTTAVRILTTLLAPTSGRAFVNGHDVVAEPRAVRESISLAGQQATLDERLTGRENLMLLARLQRLAKRDGGRALRCAAGALRDRARRRPPGRDLQRRDAAAAGPRRLPGRAPPGRLPRRADDRPGPVEPGRHVGRDRRAWCRTARRSC